LFEQREAPLAVPELQVFDDEWLRAQQEAAERASETIKANGTNAQSNARSADNANSTSIAPDPAQAEAGADGSTPLDPASSPPEPEPRFRLLDPDELELTPQYQRLAASRNFRPILHGGWVQEVVAESRSEPVRLTVL